MKKTTLKIINEGLKKARQLHPDFAENIYQVISLMTEELGEVTQAVNDDDMSHAKEEMIDLVALVIRMIEDFKNDEF